jgi:beta-lactamase class A
MFAAEPVSFATQDARLQSIVDEVAAATLTEFEGKKLLTNHLAITLVDLRDAKQWRAGGFRGGVAIYPASVVKMFYLAAAHRWMEDGKLKDSEELRRALRDMIVDSSNDATHYVLDSITGATGGPELPEAEMKIWGEKRNAVNRYFSSLGYTNINANQKPWNDGPYGRERVWVGKDFGNRNALTTDATARLLSEIALGQCVSAKHSDEMLKLHARDFTAKAGGADDQAHGFTAPGLPRDAKLWSKAGWTSTARHDAAYVELADGRRFVLVTFTTGHAKERDIIPFVTKQIVQRL